MDILRRLGTLFTRDDGDAIGSSAAALADVEDAAHAVGILQGEAQRHPVGSGVRMILVTDIDSARAQLDQLIAVARGRGLTEQEISDARREGLRRASGDPPPAVDSTTNDAPN